MPLASRVREAYYCRVLPDTHTHTYTCMRMHAHTHTRTHTHTHKCQLTNLMLRKYTRNCVRLVLLFFLHILDFLIRIVTSQ